MGEKGKEQPRQLKDIVDREGMTPEAYARIKDAHRVAAGDAPVGDLPQATSDWLELRKGKHISDTPPDPEALGDLID